MTFEQHDEHDAQAERTTRLLAHLDGVLDATMLDAMQGAWSMLEHAATDSPAHARAVRARLFWESLDPGASASMPAAIVGDLVPSWDEESGTDAIAAPDEDLDSEVAEAA